MPDKGEGVTRNHASPHRDGQPRPPVAYKWVALSVTTLGAAMAAIDSSIVVLGLPTIMTDLRSDLVTMIWALMSYILMSTVFLMPVSYTHLRAHETGRNLVCRLLLEKKKKKH